MAHGAGVILSYPTCSHNGFQYMQVCRKVNTAIAHILNGCLEGHQRISRKMTVKPPANAGPLVGRITTAVNVYLGPKTSAV